jgi:hypothetical protein
VDSCPEVQKAHQGLLPPATASGSAADGSYPEARNAIIHPRDARVRVLDGVTVSSPSGLMVSNLEQTMIVGDLVVETPKGNVHTNGAVFDAKNKVMTADRMTFTSKKAPSQATPGSAPATDTDRAPLHP